MNFGDAINSFINNRKQSVNSVPDGLVPVERTEPNLDPRLYETDILGQGVGRLMHTSHDAKYHARANYSDALQVYEEFAEIVSYREQIEFWDAHPDVFGLSTVVVFDTQENDYGPYHGQPFDNILAGIEFDSDRHKLASILPQDTEQFDLFWGWCAQKCYPWLGPNACMDIRQYWQTIRDHGLPKDYLLEQLDVAEKLRNKALEPKIHHREYALLKDEPAEDYLFSLGFRHSVNPTNGGWNKKDEPMSIYTKLITCPLSTYGAILSKYFHGYQTGLLLAFLRKQKERLDQGEDIQALPTPRNNQERFANEVLNIELSLGPRGKAFSPNLYAPVNELWQTLNSEKQTTLREAYRTYVKAEIASVMDELRWPIHAYEVAVSKQPEKQKELLLQYRDQHTQIVGQYAPIEHWYHWFWDKEQHTLTRIEDLESEIFYFCDVQKTPFIVGLKLLKVLYLASLAIVHFNRLLAADEVTGQILSPKPDGNEQISVSNVAAGCSIATDDNQFTQIDSSLSSSSFEDHFFDATNAQKIVQILKALYADNTKPRQYAYMLFALYDLGLTLQPSAAVINVTTLHQRMLASFGETVGARQGLASNLEKLDAPSQQQNLDIQSHKRRINEALLAANLPFSC